MEACLEKLPLLLVGDFTQPEFAPIADLLRAHSNVTWAPDVAAAIELLAAPGTAPQAIVLAYPSPGAIAADSLHRLREAAPLARQLAVLGTWCEGEARSGRPLAGVIRTYWHQWLPRWADTFVVPGRVDLPGWALPETAADEERLLQLAERRWPLRQGLIAIATRHFESADLLGAACRQRGYATVWQSAPAERTRIGGAVAIIWDGSGNEIDELVAFCRAAAAGTPVVALLDFPRQREIEPAIAAGVAAVLAKPLLLEDLFWHLDRLTAGRETNRRVA